MPRVLPAQCLAGVVTCEGFPIAGVEILSNGDDASTGILLIDEDKKYYVASSVKDLEAMFAGLDTVFASIVSALSALDAVSTSPGSAAALIAAVTTAKTALNLQKELLV